MSEDVTDRGQQLLSPAGLAIEELTDGEGRTLRLSGELDLSSGGVLEAAIRTCATETACAITLDLGGLTFLDTSGLWAILAVRRWCQAHGHGLALLPGPEQIQSVFEITGLSDVLPFVDTAPARFVG